jgi:ATP-binding cassette subfamily B protein
MGAGPGRPGGAPPQRSKHFWRSLRRFLGLLAPEKVKVTLAVLAGVVSVALTVSGPRILGQATNVLFDGIVGKRLPAGLTREQAIAALRAHGHGQIAKLVAGTGAVPGRGVDLDAFGRILGLAALVYAFGALFNYLQGYVLAGVVQRTMRRMRQSVEDKLSRLPLRYFDSHSHGDILSRVTNDIDNISTTLQQGLSQLLTSLLTLVGVLGMMFWISPLLAGVSAVTIPAAILLTARVARRSQTQFAAQWAETGSLNGLVEESDTGHALVQVFGRTESTIEDFDQRNERLREASFRAQFLSGTIQPAMQFVSNLNYVVIAVLGGYQVAQGLLSLGSVQAFIQYSRQFTMPLTQIASQVNLLQSGIASAERVFELLDAAEESPDPARAPGESLLPSPRGDVGLEHVSFRYTPDTPLIEDFSLGASRGRTVAIVGPTGAGKTTLVNLLVRFYEVDGGHILLDELDYRTLTRDEVRAAYAMVLQDAWLFSGTIADNIGYGKPGATREEIVAAAEAAYVDRFVRSMPAGYDTEIGEEATSLSAGQKQLLTIARAFLADPPVLILDEATSNVDTRTEVLVQAAMARLRAGRTGFVIAHRLSTIRGADTIVVMDHGRIVEQGRHEELLAGHGFYAALYESQFAGGEDTDLAAMSPAGAQPPSGPALRT